MNAATSLIARDDTILGVCEALGQDFGFNPVFLRIAFALPVMYAPLPTIAAYLALGAVVMISRLLAPRPRRALAPQPAGARAPAAAAEADQDQLSLPLAA